MKLAFKFIVFLLQVYGGEIQWLSVQFGAYRLDFFLQKHQQFYPTLLLHCQFT